VAEFGKSFRSARESRGLTIAEIAQETRISSRVLRAIEAEAFEELPGGVFSRGFIRTYASEVGLDADAMAEAYAALRPDVPLDDSPQASPRSEAGRERFVLSIAIGGLVVLAFLFWIGSRTGPAPSVDGDATGGETVAASTSLPSEALDTIESLRGPDAIEDTASIVPDNAPPADDVVPQAEDTEAAGQAPAALREEDPPVVSPITAPVRTESAEQLAVAAGNVGVAAVVAEDAGFSVRIEVHETTRIYLELDGRILYGDVTINPPFWRNYTVNEALDLRLSDPSAVSININGEPVPELGPAGAIWRGTLTHDSLGLLTQR
jgi:cytoskeleton protein RodZ